MHLRHNAVSALESTLISVAGTAPANTLATSTSTLIAAVGLSGPGALLFGAVPMFGIALSYYYLNCWRSDPGAAYAWAGSAVNPVLGFFAGWAMLVAVVLFTVVGSLPVADATLDLIAPHQLHNVALVTAIGLIWFLFVLGLVLFGVRATAQMQKVVTGIQIAGLALFGIGAVIKGIAHPANHPTWAWLSPAGGLGVHGFIAGALVTMFFFWGWEVSANLSEETVDRNRAPGVAGLLGMGIILALFVLTVLGAQLAMPTKAILDSGSDLLVALANTVVPRPWGDIAVVVVIVSAIGALETSLVSASRTIYSMGRDEVLDRRLGLINARFLTPWNATIVIGLVSMVLFAFAATSASVNQILSDSINAIGVEVAIFYGLSAVACAAHYRRLWPLAPALFVFGVALGQVVSAGAKANATVFGLLLAGFIPMAIYRRTYRSAYYR